MMDVDPNQLAGFQLGPATVNALRLRPASSMTGGFSFGNFARAAALPPGLAQMAHHHHHRGRPQRRRHHHPFIDPRQMVMHGRPPAAAMLGAGFFSRLVSTFKAKRAKQRAAQQVALENRCQALAAAKAKHAAAVLGFPWSRLRDAASAANRATKDRYGRLLISAIPYGATALEARDIANQALRSGELRPEHLAAAGRLTSAARAGDEDALTKIAYAKQKAGQGDRAAEVALDRIKLAQVIQTGGGGRGRGGGGGAHGGHYHQSGLASLMRSRG